METAVTHRIAERFSRLDPAQRRVVYQGLREKGLTPGQFPILARQGGAADGSAPVSYAQMRQWFLWQLDPQSTAYHISGALRLSGALAADLVRASFEVIVARHAALRTVFRVDAEGGVEQVVRTEACFDFTHIDLAAEPAAQHEALAMQAAQRIANTPFDLVNGPLLRAGLIRMADDTHVLVLVMHHIVSDGWSLHLMMDEFAALYRSCGSLTQAGLTPLPVTYADYAVWQRNWMEAGEQERQLDHWRAQLGGRQPVLQLPADHGRRTDGRYTAATHAFALPRALKQALQSLAQDRECTLFMVLLTAFQALLYRCSGQDDVRVGVPIANRHRVETEGLVGFFVNTQVLRGLVDPRQSLLQLLAQTREAALGAQANQDLPFEQLVEALQPERIPGIHPLFQVLFNHQRGGLGALESIPGLALAPFVIEGQAAQFELMLITEENPDGRVEARFSYAAELFDPQTIERMAGHYLALLRALAEHPEQAVGDVALMDEAETLQLRAWSENPETYEDTRPVHAQIAEQALRCPDAIAVVFGETQLSYGELDMRANRLAHRLIALGVGPEVRVGIAVERSLEMVVGLLAVLKAGGAYVPLDPEYPPERLAYMVQDSAIALLLTQSQLRALLPLPEGLPVLELDDLDLAGEPVQAPQVAVHGEHLAYVIYTSGSTGRPKGAANRHRSLSNRLIWMQQAYALAPADSVLQKTPFSFDVSVWEFFWPLMVGARLVVAGPGDHRDPERLVHLVDRHQVTTLHFVPSMLQAFLAYEGVQACTSLRRIVCSGEALPAQAQNEVFRRLPQARLYNLYGPTEAAIDVTHWTCRQDGGSQVPIGRPIAGVSTWVLDAALAAVPIGVAGELYLGGIGLARGYLHRAGLTAERFVAAEDGQRLYRTGDLVRWNGQGQLEYLGRIDQQVKLRGFRIELGEIEAQLLAQPELREAVVVAQEGPSGTRLVAYVSAHAGQRVEPAELRTRLGTVLPDYMVPSAVVVLDALPLNANGKVDRKALPAAGLASERAYEALQGEAEQALAAIWSQVLGVERIGRHDNFFELGGHSLLALRLLERLRAQGWRVQVRELFQQPRLVDFARALEAMPSLEEIEVPANGIPAEGCSAIRSEMLTLVQLDASQIARIEATVPGGAANIQDIYPLVPMQEGMLFHHLLHAGGDAYVTRHGLEFDSRESLEGFVAAFDQVIERHDILRTAVLWEGLPQPVQVVWRHAALPLQWLAPVEADTPALAFACLQAQTGTQGHRIDVRRAPMLDAVAACDARSGRWLLQVLSHHMIDDNTTLRMIGEEIAAIQRGNAQALPAPVPFRRFVAQARLNVSEAEHEDFFRRMLGDVDEPTVPFGVADVQGDGQDIEERRHVLGSTLAHALRQAARRQGVSAAALLHLAWSLVLTHTTGRADVVFGTVLFGRMQGDGSAGRALGMFVNTLPLRFQVDARGVEAGLRAMQDALGALMRHEHASLALAQRCSALPAATPLFSALLNYRHTPTLAQAAGAAGLAGMRVLDEKERTNFPVALSINDLGDDFVLVSQVRRPIDAEQVCELVRRAVEAVVDALTSRPEQPMCEITLLSGMEREQLRAWSDRRTDAFDAEHPVHALIAEQARRCPDAIAVVFGETQLSYGELDMRANRLAHRLIALGVGPEVRVGIAVERSLEMVVGLLAVLKAGGAYVPLDPEYPPERLAYMVQDSAIALLLTQSQLRALLPLPEGLPVLELDDLDLAGEPVQAPQVAVHGEHLAYVIYTSGSTGRPKGAANRHRSLSNRLIWMQQAYALAPADSVLQKTPFSFDVSVWEFFWPLMVGARLVVAGPGDHRDPERLVHLVDRHQVTTLHFVPSMLQAFLAYEGVQACTSLRRIVCSGEALPAQAQNEVFRRLPQARLYNLYGPTEAAIDVTHWTCRQDGGSQVPIGRPIAGVSTWVLDAALAAVPIGVAGELYLGGIGLARGYLHRAGLTAERFVAAEDGQRLYRTGDLVRWNGQGQLEYLGRIDQQVKLRGFRIELGEIEAQLLAQPELREAVVVAQEGPSGTRLVAFVSAHAGQRVEPAELRTRLGTMLPDYMVPSAVVVLDALPLNANGKVDRKALPAAELLSERAYEAPQGEAEQALAAIWSQVLGVERIGRHDNFFELGGHSLLALRLLERLRAQGWRAQVRELFQQPRLVDFARALEATPSLEEIEVPANGIPAEGCSAIRPEMLTLVQLEASQIARIEAAVPGGAANIQDIYPLVPMQEGMLFHHLLHAGGDAYVMHIGLSFDSREGLEGFLAAFNQVIARHDILRTAVLWEDLPQPVQVVWRHAPLRLQWLDPEREASGPLSDVAARLRGFVEPARLRIDVRRAPMLAAIAAHDPTQGRWLLQIPHHHLGVDHATIERIVEEIALLRQGRAEDLPAPVPFRRFVAQARLGVSEAEHEDFFRRMLGDVDEPTAPFGLMDVLADGSHVREAQLALEPALARQLRNEAQRHGVSAATLFHLAYALVLSQSTGRNDVVFGTVLLGRMQGGADAGQALGMFVNTLPLRARLGGRTVTQALREMQQGLTELLHHEQASLSLALRASAMPERLPLFTALLNYRHSAVGEAAAAPTWPGMEVLDREERTNYPFDLSVDDTGEGFVLVAQVEERIDPERVIALMLAATQAIVQALALEPERRISALDLVPARERAMLAAWGRGDGAGAGAPPAHRLFERQAQACPHAPALVSEGRTLSYAALDRQANRLAHHLIALGVRPEDRVGVALPRCADLFIGLLAVLKAGAAYVPLDPDYPAERLAHMVADSGMARVLTLSALQGRLPPSAGLTLVALDRLAFGPDAPVHDPALTVHPQQLAYVVYTSGSTGRAKGVAVPHGPLGMHLQAITRRYGLVRGDRLLQFTSISFDAAAEQWLGPWSTGATVVVAGAGRQSPQELLRLACAEQVNVLYFAPALMRHVSEAVLQGAAAPDVRLCIVGGEAWSRPDFLQANAAFGPERLHNAYGPTECVVTPCAWSGNGAVPDGGPTMPVGRAVGDRHAVVLGADLDPLPRGAVGELYLGGQGLARGYLGRAAWSAERFVAAEGGGRLYRTGDLVRWNERGELEYMGRADQQLKLHGFRIEPGEIESQLRAQPQVREAAVVAAQDRLVAYVALHAGQVLDAAALRRHLEQTLPVHMVPALIVQVDALPLTPNGKLDRQALPLPGPAIERPYEAPHGEVEQALAAIWAQVLGVARVGRQDHFFELGGHSLAVLQVQTRVQAAFGVQLQLRTYFETPSLADVGAALREALAGSVQESEALDRMADLLDALEDD